MKLIRYRENGSVKPGIILEESYFDVSAFGEDYNEAFFETGGLQRLQQFVADNAQNLPRLSQNIVLDSPVARPSKIVCVGLNYASHARETGAVIPSEPVLFMKSTTALCGPFDDIVIPRNSQKTDWEVELAFVIGKKASYVEEAEALEYVAGYCLHNDVSERAFQLEKGGTWDKGKGCDTFAPIGPFLATADEIPDPGALRLWLLLNGKKMQDGHTSDFIFPVPYLIHYISQYMTLLPGDIVSTGTPSGVGLGLSPQLYLKEGDVVELGIDGLGASRQRVKAYKEQLQLID
jgi:2,4-didehydro-3-deoxy-L-rhamnonate hydrolase